MTNELEPIPTTAAGWPYLPDTAPVHDVPAYTQLLTQRLAGMTPSGGAAVRAYGALYNAAQLALTETSGWVKVGLPDTTGPMVGLDVPAAGRLRCKTAGVYLVFAKLHIGGATVGDIEIRKNGTFIPGTTQLLTRAANSGTDIAGSTFGLVSLAVNDYVELIRNAGQAVTLQAARGLLMAVQIA